VKAIVSSNWSGSRQPTKRYKFARLESSLRWRYICTVICDEIRVRQIEQGRRQAVEDH
jgi:hypothetical protein